MIVVLKRGAIPNGERKGRWYFLCPECARPARELLPHPGEPHRPLQAAAWGWTWAPCPDVPEVRVQVRGASVSLLGSLPWACRRCRSVPSEASRLDKRARAERHLEARAADGRAGQRRPGESWAEELRRQQRAAAARRLVEASAMTRLGRVLNFRPPGPGWTALGPATSTDNLWRPKDGLDAAEARRRGQKVWQAYAERLKSGPRSPAFLSQIGETGAELLKHIRGVSLPPE